MTAADAKSAALSGTSDDAAVPAAEMAAGAAALSALARVQFGGAENFLLWLLEQQRQAQSASTEHAPPSPPFRQQWR